ncbi:MAG: hypothetical protein M1817_004349 [Caeruleum heppii]|nr:MAG: hypothetical protein M1817_004349 [Caeruleum heppii]
MKLRSFVRISALLDVISGLQLVARQPIRTDVAGVLDHYGRSPLPTRAPSVAQFELKKQKRSHLPVNYCGWLSGSSGTSPPLNSRLAKPLTSRNPDTPYRCGQGSTCWLLYPTSTDAYSEGMAGCCTDGDYSNCSYRRTCIERDEMTRYCGSLCSSDTLTLKCTDESYPYCEYFTFYGLDAVDFECASTSASSWRTIETTFSGQGQETFVLPSVTLTRTQTRTVTDTSTKTPTTSRTSLPTDSAPASNDLPPIPAFFPRDNSPPIGAIIGGVLGGLVIIGIVAVVILLIYLRNRRKRRAEKAAAAGQGLNAAEPQYASTAGPNGYAPVHQHMSPPMHQPYYHQPLGISPDISHDPSKTGYQPTAQSYEINPHQHGNYYGPSDVVADPQKGVSVPVEDRPFSAEIDGTPSTMEGSPLPRYASQGDFASIDGVQAGATPNAPENLSVNKPENGPESKAESKAGDAPAVSSNLPVPGTVSGADEEPVIPEESVVHETPVDRTRVV